MHSIKSQFDYFVSKITPVYGMNEAKSIAFLFFEEKFGLAKSDILLNNSIALSFDFTSTIDRLLSNEPIQYILGFADFCGLKFYVNQDTLIPRNETEELVSFVINKLKALQNETENVRILDIGTGTGCIAISIAKAIENLHVTAWDISETALEIAQKNNALNQTYVIFENQNILDENTESAVLYDFIVSNPPYVTNAEKTLMHKNVLNFEPHLALFVEDSDPLIFYKKIAAFSFKNLKSNGYLVVEINENFGLDTVKCFIDAGFSNPEIIRDIHGKERIISAIKP